VLAAVEGTAAACGETPAAATGGADGTGGGVARAEPATSTDSERIVATTFFMVDLLKQTPC